MDERAARPLVHIGHLYAVEKLARLNSPEIHDTRDALSALATKLRGLAR